MSAPTVAVEDDPAAKAEIGAIISAVTSAADAVWFMSYAPLCID
ncbi:hypothetical protein SX4_2334 [Vibrio mimicus SX-4]|nr:hypothetical protein VII_003354 [Vibrio mimicus MB451]EGU17589.1 hypothetical protein SX4_2334 [Vibrio mimicus SX-4]